ncbi:hypothetical protein BKA56DRAFT_45543 [Ilyonectria sp. MPI-CAGE-AT-0026]|nr:hypothetical protein BKA56DRAFT_45543 [Ilyonectria sp. MPI-CAGE-AT-0026]
MCYYDEVRWTCGWRWRYFRQECKSQQLIHVMCDQEFIHETWAYPDVCGLCHDTEAKQRQYDKMFRDVQQWQRDGDRSAMIGEISSKMQDLKQEIFWMKGDHERKLRSFRDEEDAFAVIPSIRFPVEYPIPLRDDTLPASAASSNPNSTSNPLVSRPLVSRPLVRSPSPRNFPMPGDVQTAIITSSSHADHGRVITDDPPTTRNKSSGASRDAESSTTKSTANTTSINADKVCLICQRKHLNCNGVKPCTSCINLNTLCIYKKTRKPKTDDVEGAGADLNTSALSSATGLDRQTGSKESLLQYTVEHNSLSTVNDTENVGNTKGDYEKTWHTTHSRSPIHSCPDMMGHCVQLSADRNLEMVSDDLSGFAKNASTRKQDASILNCLDMLSVSDPKHTANERSPRNLSSMDTSHNKNGTCRELEMSAPSTLNVNPGAHHDFGNASEDGFDNISTCSMSEGSGVISVTESTAMQGLV